MMDGVIRQAIDEAIRFLPPGVPYVASLDGHELVIIATGSGVRTGGRRPYLVACRSCMRLLDETSTNPYHAGYRHTTES